MIKFFLLLSSSFVHIILAKDWHGLSFDPENFMCEKWDAFCGTVLDGLNCSPDVSQREMMGCANFPQEKDVANWIGVCECLSPVAYSAGTHVTRQLIANRIVPDMNWMLEPWATGPPYDGVLSYKNICRKVLHRLGCHSDNQTVFAQDVLLLDSSGNPIPDSNFKCTCGTMTAASTQVTALMMERINQRNQRSTPIFSNPVYLTVPMSICIVLITGKLGAIIAVYLKLPSITGFLLAGLGIQNILNPMFLQGAGFPFPAPAAAIKLIGLIIVLMRAGLSIKFEEISDNALATFLTSVIPYMVETMAFMYIGKSYFPTFSITTMGLFAAVMAPLGPSVVISGLLNLIGSSKRNPGYVGKQVVISSSIEAVLASLLFSIFTILEQSGVENKLHPWVATLSLQQNCLLIPANIAFSIAMGIAVGALASWYIDWRSRQKTDFIWYRVNKNPQMGSSTADLVFVLLVLCYTMMSLCVSQYIQQSSGGLVVFVASITVSRMADPQIVADIAMGLKSIWVFAEVFLFTLTGTALCFDSSNGPLYGQRGISTAIFRDIFNVMFCATACRFAALGLICLMLYPTFPPHRQRWQWLLPFWITMYIFQLPKGTVQSTLGEAPFYRYLIPGPNGANQGQIIAQATSLAVLIFAPLGALLTNYVGSPLSIYLLKLDKQAGWNQETHSYDKIPEIASEVQKSSRGSLEGVELTNLDNSVTAFQEGAEEDEGEEEEIVVCPRGQVLRDPHTIDGSIQQVSDLLRRYLTEGASNKRSGDVDTSAKADSNRPRASTVERVAGFFIGDASSEERSLHARPISTTPVRGRSRGNTDASASNLYMGVATEETALSTANDATV